MQNNEDKIQLLKNTLEKVDKYVSKARKIFDEIEPTIDNYDYLLNVMNRLQSQPEIDYSWDTEEQMLFVHTNGANVDESLMFKIFSAKFQDLEYDGNEGSTNGNVYCYKFSKEHCQDDDED